MGHRRCARDRLVSGQRTRSARGRRLLHRPADRVSALARMAILSERRVPAVHRPAVLVCAASAPARSSRWNPGVDRRAAVRPRHRCRAYRRERRLRHRRDGSSRRLRRIATPRCSRSGCRGARVTGRLRRTSHRAQLSRICTSVRTLRVVFSPASSRRLIAWRRTSSPSPAT